MTPSVRHLATPIAFLSVVAVSCDSVSPPGPPADILFADPPPAEADVGAWVEMTVKVVDGEARGVPGIPIAAWITRTGERYPDTTLEEVVVVDTITDGQGRARVGARLGSLAAGYRIRVSPVGHPGAVDQVVLARPGPFHAVETGEDTLTLEVSVDVQPLDSFGNRLDRPVTWTSSDPGVITVDDAGTLRTVTPGSAVLSGRGDGVLVTRPITVVEPAAFDVVALASGHACAMRRRQVFCWGPKLLAGSEAPSQSCRLTPTIYPCYLRPVAVASDLPMDTVVAAGSGGFAGVSCGLTASGEAWCWGTGPALGVPGLLEAGRPVRVRTDLRFSRITVGPRHACALDATGRAYCWGENRLGALGVGDFTGRPSPTATQTELRFVDLVAGGEHTCGLVSGGAVWCWGANDKGQLGDGRTLVSEPRGQSEPVRVTGGVRFEALAAGGGRTCALDGDGEAWCWGENDDHELGNGSTTASDRPGRVASAPPFVQLSAGAALACGLTETGDVWCWGRNPRTASPLERDLPEARRFDAPRPFHFISVAQGICGLALDDRTFCLGAGGSGDVGTQDGFAGVLPP